MTKKNVCYPDTDHLSFLFRYGPVIGDLGGKLMVLLSPSIWCVVVKKALGILVLYKINGIFFTPALTPVPVCTIAWLTTE